MRFELTTTNLAGRKTTSYATGYIIEMFGYEIATKI